MFIGISIDVIIAQKYALYLFKLKLMNNNVHFFNLVVGKLVLVIFKINTKYC